MPSGIYKHKPNQGFQKGHISIGKGIPRTKEVKEKISKSKIGHQMKDGQGFQKGHKINLGKKYSKKWRENISKNHNPISNKNLTYVPPKGTIPWNKGTGIKSFLRNKIRSCIKYWEWRTSVFKRDNFTCQWCNKRGGELEAHHINPFIKILRIYNIKSLNEAENCSELWDINNGITLCKKCHNKTKNGNKKYNK